MSHLTAELAEIPEKSRCFPLRLIAVVAVVLLIVTVRLPFLVRGEQFFDSDEAVEGLMARHVWQGEWPVFLWGQGYKGVPEVYLTSALLRVAEPTPLLLKLATAIVFAVFVALQFLLVERLSSRRIAWATAALTIVSTPAAVFWSGWELARDSVNLALDGVPRGIELSKVRDYLGGLEGVSEVHDLHVWAMSTNETALTVHLVRPGGTDDQFLHLVCEELSHRFNIHHATLQIEAAGDVCKLAPAERV